MSEQTFASARDAQRNYTNTLDKQGHGYDLVVGATFVQGMREQGYRTTARAINELIDNAMEAGASNIWIVAGLQGKEDSPSRYAVVDDGHGMEPNMVRASVLWGGTHRANSRTGIGRFGFGLPTSCVSQGRRYSVYSRVEGGSWNSVTIDLDDIAEGKVDFDGGRIIVPPAQPAELPRWIVDPEGKPFADKIETGTVVVVEKVDRLKPRKWTTLERDLLQFFGVTYRNFLRECSIYVGSKKVSPVDPLFLTPGAKDYEISGNPIKALPLPGKEFKAKAQDGHEALIKIRCSVMPPGFATEDGRWGRSTKRNARFGVLKDNHGLLILRNGRQMDTVLSSNLFPENIDWTFKNNDRYWKVEIDFSAELDEDFGVTTNKQQVVLSDRMWQILKDNGLFTTMKGLREMIDKLIVEASSKAQDAEETKPDEPRSSEKVLAEAQKYRRTPRPESKEQTERRQTKLKQEIDKVVAETGAPREEVAQQKIRDTAERPYKIEYEDIPGAPFFRLDVLGAQNRLFINKSHPFYPEVYAHGDTTPRLRAALEILLFVLGEGELNSNHEIALFYQTERPEWSGRLNTLLALLKDVRGDFEAETEPLEDE